MSSYHIYGQVESMPVNEECFEIDRRDAEYFIQVNGVNYQDGDDVYLCDNNDDIQIQLIYNLPNDPLNLQTIIGNNWNWNDCNCNVPNPEGPEFLVTEQNFGTNKDLKVKVTFDDVGRGENNVTLKINLNKTTNVSIDYKKTRSHNTVFAFDENVYENYPFYFRDVPWKFITSTQGDDIVLKGNKSIASQNVFTSTPPNVLSTIGDEKIVNISYSGQATRDSASIHWCDAMDTIALLDIYNGTKHYPLHIWTLRESDDDIINYCLNNNSLMSDCVTPITSNSHECILPGPDGTFDLYLSDNQPWINHSSDSVIYYQQKRMKVLAGKDRSCQSKVYPTKKPLEDPPIFSMSDLISNTNTILNTAGIQMNLVNHGELIANFDLRGTDDNEAEYFEATMVYRVNNFIQTYKDLPCVFIFADLKEPPLDPGQLSSTLRGQSQGGSFFTMFDGNRMVERTLAHELGHAIWDLQHPDEVTGSSDPITVDDLKAIVTDDPANLMTSGSRGNQLVNNSILRRYVWKRMQTRN